MVKEINNIVRVLYVDDVQANLMLFEASFGDYYEVVLADSGKKALDILKSREIHVLVSDQHMPGMTGNELLEIVAEAYPDVMRFMITAYTDYDVVVDVINRGDPYGFFNKPYNKDDVRKAIDRSMEVRNLRIHNREMLKKLEKANEMMRGLDRSKTKFLVSVTDEIRVPINKIMTTVHMIKDKIDSRELADLLNLLDSSVRKLEGFSDSTRHLARLYDPEFKLEKKSVSLKELIDIGIIEKGNVITSKEIKIEFDAASADCSVSGEFDLLQSAFSSLLEFVFDRTAPGTEIVISINESPDNIILSVWCKGCTFSEKEKEELLTLSSDFESNAEKDFRMELFLAGEMMNAHEGKLKYTVKDKGSEISLVFKK